MSRVCTVCAHPERKRIDQALAAGESVRTVGAKFGVSPDAAKRHRGSHVPVRLVQEQALAEVREGLDIARQLVTINAAALALLEEARETGFPETALRAIDRVIKTLELQLRLTETQDLEKRLAALEAAQATTSTRGTPSAWR